MSSSAHNIGNSALNGTDLLANALYSYLSEVQGHYDTCAEHVTTAAVHDVGKTLQVFRMFKSDEMTINCLRKNCMSLPEWEQSCFWLSDNKDWSKVERGVVTRMKIERRNKGLLPILTRGIEFEGMPLLIHAYKFEADPAMKIELLPMQCSQVENPPLFTVAHALRCHEFLVPDYMAEPLPFGQYHDAKILTLWEYLHRTMPPNLYANRCLQRVSCHARNGVGSRDTLREHQGEPASHSFVYGQTQVT